MGVYMSLFSIGPALAVWRWPEGSVWGWLLALGVVATAAHLCLNRAFGKSDAAFIAPFGFVQIPFVAFAGYVVYAEMPDTWTWAGALVIMASGIYTAHREAKVSQTISAVPQPGVVVVGRE